jgi:hypothetical protein
MLRASYAPTVTDQDQLIFDMLIPSNHYLRQVNALVDFEQYRAMMAVCYHATDGRPADDPVVLLKIGFLQTHYNRLLSPAHSCRGLCQLSHESVPVSICV